MSVHPKHRPAPAGLVDDLSDVSRFLVLSLRNWLEGPDAQAEVWNAFALGLGKVHGRRALAAFEAYLEVVAGSALRCLCRHAPGCPCLGRDEADLAAIVSLALGGDIAAASARAAGIVRAEFIGEVVDCASALGLALQSFDNGRGEGPGPGRCGFRTLH